MKKALQEADYKKMVECAMLYYENKLSQIDIAQQLKITQSTVSKLLKQARKEGIVHTSIKPNYFRQLEHHLKTYFNLLDVHVVHSSDYDFDKTGGNLSKTLGITTARYFENLMRDENREGGKIGIGGGYTMFEFVNAVSIVPICLKVYPLLAWGDHDLRIHVKHASSIVTMWWAKQIDNIEAYKLEYPPVKNKKTCLNKAMSNILHEMDNIDIILASCGHIDDDSTFAALVKNIGLDPNLLKNEGVIGDFIGYPITYEGTVIDAEIAKNFFDLVYFPLSFSRISQLAKDNSKRIILTAGGRKKIHTIAALLKGGLMNVLITDDKSATLLLKMANVLPARAGQA